MHRLNMKMDEGTYQQSTWRQTSSRDSEGFSRLLQDLTCCWLRETQPNSHINTITVALIIHPLNFATGRSVPKCQGISQATLSMHLSKHHLTHESLPPTLLELDNLYCTFPYTGTLPCKFPLSKFVFMELTSTSTSSGNLLR